MASEKFGNYVNNCFSFGLGLLGRYNICLNIVLPLSKVLLICMILRICLLSN